MSTSNVALANLWLKSFSGPIASIRPLLFTTIVPSSMMWIWEDKASSNCAQCKVGLGNTWQLHYHILVWSCFETLAISADSNQLLGIAYTQEIVSTSLFRLHSEKNNQITKNKNAKKKKKRSYQQPQTCRYINNWLTEHTIYITVRSCQKFEPCLRAPRTIRLEPTLRPEPMENPVVSASPTEPVFCPGGGGGAGGMKLKPMALISCGGLSIPVNTKSLHM